MAPMDDAFMDEQLLIMNEREQERAVEAQKRADNAAHRKVYADAMAKWTERRQMFCAAGFPMSHAGDKPLLYQIKAGNYNPQSNIPPDQEENSLEVLRRRTKCLHISIDSVPGKEFDTGDTDSVEASEAWSAHDESN